jgi:type IV secretion system protein VirB9
MRRHTVGFLLFGLVMASPSLAAERPLPGQQDSRMRYIAYDPGQVVHLSTAVGATLVVGFGAKETVTAVAATDSKDLKAMPKGNFLFFKSQQPLPLQPVIVLTTNDAGETRRYVFEITTIDTNDLGPGAPEIYYSVQFTYPADERAKRRALAAARAAKALAVAQANAAQAQLQLAHDQLEERARDPLAGDRNWHYVAQGDRSLLPLEVFDNGYSTVFRFPGNVRIPSVFVINPDGKEATPNYAVKGDLVEADSVARGWRLRDGQTVLCIWNRAFDPVGKNPGTETTSPNVQRVLRDVPP